MSSSPRPSLDSSLIRLRSLRICEHRVASGYPTRSWKTCGLRGSHPFETAPPANLAYASTTLLPPERQGSILGSRRTMTQREGSERLIISN